MPTTCKRLRTGVAVTRPMEPLRDFKASSGLEDRQTVSAFSDEFLLLIDLCSKASCSMRCRQESTSTWSLSSRACIEHIKWNLSYGHSLSDSMPYR